LKAIGDVVTAAFMTPLDAVRASLTTLDDLAQLNGQSSNPLILKIGIHRGHSIAVTLNERLDYFGQTVNIAARVQGLADANEIYLSDEVYHYPGVADILAGCDVETLETDIKGVRGKIFVHRVRVG
jgi:class 3 adenylate cyclase